MDDSPQIKKKHKKSDRKKSPVSRNDQNDENSQKGDKQSQSNKRRHEREDGKPRKYSRKDRDADSDVESSRYERYWSSRDEKVEHEFEEREKRHIPHERYWGEGENKRKDHRSGKSEKSRKFNDDKYLVGSRYYEEPKSKKNTSPKSARDEGLAKDNSDKENGFKEEPPKALPQKKTTDIITSRTGGAYIPPGKLKLMQASITDKSSAEYQRIAWEALKKSIHGHINKVNTSNIGVVARLLFKENIIRGRGLLCRSIIQAQSASVTFTNVYACLVAIINSKFPNIGELLLKRVIIRFKRAYKRNDKAVCISSATFIAHLINQRVAHEILGLELVTLLVENPTDDSIEVAVAFLKEAGQKLSEVSSRGTNAIFDMLRNILHEGKLEKRVQYMIEVMFQVRKDDFATFPSVPEELDLVDEEDQFTHILSLDDAIEPQEILNVFKLDTDYQANEEKYKELRNEILETDSEGSASGSEDSSSEGEESDEGEEEDEEKKITIVDNTETNLVAFRKTIYLTIQSSLDFEECAHKLLKMEIKPGQEKELCHMFLDCCAEQRTYEKFFGLLSQRFCQVNKMFITPFEEIFAETYSTVHRLDTNRLRNVAKLFAHLLFTDAISWAVLVTIRLNEEDTTSSSRIFIKILFQELSEYMGLANLNSRLKDPTLQSSMEGLFPRDNPKNTRFAINFFTSIGLGGLTDELREHLKNLPKPVPVSQLIQELSSATSSSSSSEDSSSDSDSSSSSSTSSSEEEEAKKKQKRKSQKAQGEGKSSKKIEKNKNEVKDKTKNKKSSSEPNSISREEDNGERVMNEKRQKDLDPRRQWEKHAEEKERNKGNERHRYWDENDKGKGRRVDENHRNWGNNESQRGRDGDQRKSHRSGGEKDWENGDQLRNRDYEKQSEERHRHRNNSDKHSTTELGEKLGEHRKRHDRHNSEKRKDWDSGERSRDRDNSEKNSEKNNSDKHRFKHHENHKERDNNDRRKGKDCWENEKDGNEKHKSRENSEKHRVRDNNEKCSYKEKSKDERHRARESGEKQKEKSNKKHRQRAGGDIHKGRDSDD